MLHLHERKKQIKKVLLITLFLNLTVSTAKIIYGWLTNSVAIYSDGFHSLFDGISNMGGLIALSIASHPPDREHPYGHRKFETVFAIFIGVLMSLTALEIIRNVYQSFIEGKKPETDEKAFIVLVFTLIVNIFVAFYEKKKGKELKSEFLIADSAHTRSDIYITLGVIGSVTLTTFTEFYFIDPLAGLIVGVFVAREAILIIKESANILADRTAIDGNKIVSLVETCSDVEACRDVRTRGTAGQIFVDLKILINPSISVSEAHDIAEKVEELIKKEFPDVVDVVVHVEPFEKN
ncbi:MAG: cation diffusion facilitator family transporter [Thermodesulfovibrio sp.]|uniref:cation diffusion facilitator family transporter n=1 Tax=Thermodesulfovibrio sp. 1176 TaxID=3043424 RepID=UPI0024829EAA|nr:cation diffusion facilitator family transporter [Thermodesulfovibrio sp. 1176]MDI1472462.1 cation diffusion facilitator family transporter [Thermodesulfovibrio sp. 1176]MDI6714500.1 cation diffusion facilitator family transporter [Thermodesulfovibrio sp.]